jgi:hypothetical protein
METPAVRDRSDLPQSCKNIDLCNSRHTPNKRLVRPTGPAAVRVEISRSWEPAGVPEHVKLGLKHRFGKRAEVLHDPSGRESVSRSIAPTFSSPGNERESSMWNPFTPVSVSATTTGATTPRCLSFFTPSRSSRSRQSRNSD